MLVAADPRCRRCWRSPAPGSIASASRASAARAESAGTAGSAGAASIQRSPVAYGLPPAALLLLLRPPPFSTRARLPRRRHQPGELPHPPRLRPARRRVRPRLQRPAPDRRRARRSATTKALEALRDGAGAGADGVVEVRRRRSTRPGTRRSSRHPRPPPRRTTQTTDLVDRLRDDVDPGALEGTNPRRTSAAPPRRSSTSTTGSPSGLPLFIASSSGSERPAADGRLPLVR